MGPQITDDQLKLLVTINALEHSGNAPNTVEALKKIYEETYGIPIKKVS